MKFTIEQIAIAPKDPIRAADLLRKMGAEEWTKDQVSARGYVKGEPNANTADLQFNYSLFAGNDSKPGEFEILNYTGGNNWVDSATANQRNIVSHLGMHVTNEQLIDWRKFFANEKIKIAQEVFTHNHTNPIIAGKRCYNYVIFDTRHILGVDIKLIVRQEMNS